MFDLYKPYDPDNLPGNGYIVDGALFGLDAYWKLWMMDG